MSKAKKKRMPTGKIPSRESVVAAWLFDLISSGQLSDAIKGTDAIELVVEAANQPNHLPAFSIDRLSRLSSAQAAKFVLGQLGLLEIVSFDTSISMATGEVLRPDIIAYNPDSRVVVVFEVKREKGPERQAVSELAGYEHELQNLFPFLSNMEVCFVVVARDWSELLQHGVASLTTWSGKQVLALSLDYDAEPRELRCQIVEAWHPTGTVGVPDDAMQCFDLVLYEETDEPLVRDNAPPPPIVQTAISMIARDGDRIRSHGFLMLWRDLADFSGAKWVLTICALDPGVFHARLQATAQGRISQLAKYFSVAEGLSWGSMPNGGYRVLDGAKKLLSEDYDVLIENHGSWAEKIQQHRHRSEPVLFEFWGAPGDFSRSFVSSETVRSSLLSFLPTSKIDWTHPLVAIPTIGYLTGRVPFVRGQVFCEDLFEAGKTLGVLLMAFKRARALASEDPDQNDAASTTAARATGAFVNWVLPEAVALMAELAQLYRSYQSMDIPPPALSNRPEKSVESVEAIVEWVVDHLIGESEIHGDIFNLGLNLGGAFELLESGRLSDETPEGFETVCRRAIRFCHYVTGEMLERIREKHYPKRDIGSAKAYLEAISSVTGIQVGPDLIDSFQKLKFPELLVALNLAVDRLDDLVFPVHHALVPTAPLKVDVEALKNAARHIFQQGDKRPAIIVEVSGDYAVGHLPEEGKFLPPLEDVETAVYFLDHRVGFSMAVKMTWNDIVARFGEGL